MSINASVYNSVVQRLLNTTSRIQARIQDIEQKMDKSAPHEPLPVFNGNIKEANVKDELETLAQRIEYIENNTNDMAIQFQKVKDVAQAYTKSPGMSQSTAKEDFNKMEEFVQTKTSTLKNSLETLNMSLREEMDDIKIDRKLLKERVDVCNHNVKLVSTSFNDKLSEMLEKISALDEKINVLNIRQNTFEKHMSESHTNRIQETMPQVEPKSLDKVQENKIHTNSGNDGEDSKHTDILKDLENLTSQSQNQTCEDEDPLARRRISRRKKPVQ